MITGALLMGVLRLVDLKLVIDENFFFAKSDPGVRPQCNYLNQTGSSFPARRERAKNTRPRRTDTGAIFRHA